MPYRSEIDPPAGLATVAAEPGPSDLLDTIAALRGLAGDARLGPGFGVLLDVRAATTAPRAGEAREIAWALASPSVLGGHPVALLVAAAPVQVGMGNMIATLGALGGGEVDAFTDATEALAWLAARSDAPRGSGGRGAPPSEEPARSPA